LTLGLFYLAIYARLTRAAMLEVADQDFVKTARAKGVPEGRILRAHVLRNALLPVITFAGIQAGQLIGGSILVETVFAWPGIGRLAFDALLARDYNLLLGVFVCTSAMVVGFNIVTDLLYAAIDPRIEVAQWPARRPASRPVSRATSAPCAARSSCSRCWRWPCWRRSSSRPTRGRWSASPSPRRSRTASCSAPTASAATS